MSTIRFESKEDNLNVYIGNHYVGTTPVDITDVPNGRYKYRLEKSKNNYLSGELYVYSDKITLIETNFSLRIIEEKYLDIGQIEQLQEECSKPSTELVIPSDEPVSEQKQPVVPIPKEEPEKSKSPPLLDEETKKPDEISQETSIEKAILEELRKTNTLLESIKDNNTKQSEPCEHKKYFNLDRTAITVSTPDKPESPDVISNPNTTPPTPGYDRLSIYDIMDRISDEIHIINDGTSDIFVIKSDDGRNFSASEISILVGESRTLFSVYEIRLRSISAGNTTTLRGGVYRVTEYPCVTSYSSTVTNPGFKAASTVLSTSVVGILIPAVAGQRFRITHIDMTARNNDGASDGIVFINAFFSGVLQIVASLYVPIGAGDFATAKASTPENMLTDENANVTVTTTGNILFRVSVGGVYETI